MENQIIQKSVRNFKTKFISQGSILKLAKESLNTKLYEFSTNKSKFEFLNLLRNEIYADLQKHLSFCQTKNCGTQSQLETALFVTDEELESLNEYYIPKYVGEDEFSADEKSDMSMRLDRALDILEKNGFVNQYIAEEIEDLKEQLPLLGKKNFFQLAKSKFYDMAIKFLITKEVIVEAFKQIAHDLHLPFLK